MVSRYFTNKDRYFKNPNWPSGAIIEWRNNDTKLYCIRGGICSEWEINDKYKTPEEALNRCLKAVERGAWIEVNMEKCDTPETEVVAW
jgi:hypothetical protein